MEALSSRRSVTPPRSRGYGSREDFFSGATVAASGAPFPVTTKFP